MFPPHPGDDGHAQEHDNATIRKKVAICRINCLLLEKPDLTGKAAPLEDPRFLGDLTGGRDEGADAGIGGPAEIHARFDGAEDRHGQMLIGGRGRSKPGVVGDVDEHFRTTALVVCPGCGENAFIADQDPEPMAVHG